MTYERVLTIKFELPVAEGSNINKGTTQDRVAAGAHAFIDTIESEGLGVDGSKAVVTMSYDYIHFYGEVPLRTKRRR